MNTIRESFTLKGKVAVITGGLGFLGKEFGATLAEAGARVFLADISPPEKTNCPGDVISLEINGQQVFYVPVDVSQKESVQNMVTEVVKRAGRIDILVNNAATKSENFFASFEDFPLEDWNRVMEVNLTGVFLCSQLAGKEMLKQNRGNIINIASIYGVVAPDQRIYNGSKINTPAIYSASKGGVIALTRYLAAYWADKNIRVNCITPGGVYDGQQPEFVSNYCNRTPMAKMADKKDLQGALLYLASDASAYVTGHNLVVDGGWTVW